MPIERGTKEDVRDRNDIVDVVSEYLALQKAGSAYQARCPFHQEKTPSFKVNPQRQTYHCFGCGAGGDVFNFVMQMQNTDFVSALRLLAKRAGIEIEFSQTESRLAPLYAALESACSLYQHQFQDSPAQEFISDKGINQELASQFRLGWAPKSWDFLLENLESRFDIEKLLEAGLIKRTQSAQSRRGVYDAFRARVMFPILDSLGRVISFTARTLDEVTTENPKYINGPETPVYKKSNVLYGLNFARREIIATDRAIIVEGAPDVIACHQNNYINTIAGCGTSVTDAHIELIKKCNPEAEIVIVFDNDKGGIESATRLSGRIMGRANTRVAMLPLGKDPDDIFHEGGDLEQYLSAAKPTSQFFIEQKSEGRDKSSAEGLLGIIASVKPQVREVPKESQGIVLDCMAKHLGIDVLSLRDDIFGYQPRLQVPRPSVQQQAHQVQKAQQIVYENGSRNYLQERLTLMLLASGSHEVIGCFLPKLQRLDFNSEAFGLLSYMWQNRGEQFLLSQSGGIFHEEYLRNISSWISQKMGFVPNKQTLKKLLRPVRGKPTMTELEETFFSLVTINMGSRFNQALRTKKHSLADLEALAEKIIKDLEKGGI